MELTDLAMSRRILRDIATCREYPDVVAHLGLVPAGPDVDSTEHLEAHLRQEAVRPIAFEIMEHAERIGNVLAAIGEDQFTDADFFVNIAQRAAIGVVTHLLDSGLVELP